MEGFLLFFAFVFCIFLLTRIFNPLSSVEPYKTICVKTWQKVTNVKS